jgi:poly-beta-1,6-N-acetyl-D-glucosamine synthase
MPVIPGESRRYVVVSPVRNEAEYLGRTIQSMTSQTLCPAQWVVVNDGSVDGTAEMIEQAAAEHPWIVAVHRTGGDRTAATQNDGRASGPGRGKRAREAKEIEAFYEGYQHLTAADWEFVVKLDGDVGFDADYFEKCLAEFAADPKLGIGGGTIYNAGKDGVRLEATPGFHVRGATKIYRRGCWEQIGGVLRGAAWDTADEVKANQLGWRTRSFSDLKVVHYRPTGAANGAWQNAVKNGVWSYIAGYHPLFMLFRCGKRLFRKPYGIGALGLLTGFALGYLRRMPQIEDRSTIRFLRQQQLRRLTLRSTVWK